MWDRWPVQVWCMKQDTQSRYAGTTQRDGMGREGGGGLRDGGTRVHTWPIRVDVWRTPPQYCKLITLHLILQAQHLQRRQWSRGEEGWYPGMWHRWKQLSFPALFYHHTWLAHSAGNEKGEAALLRGKKCQLVGWGGKETAGLLWVTSPLLVTSHDL